MESPLSQPDWQLQLQSYIHEEEEADLFKLESKNVQLIWKCERCESPFSAKIYERFRPSGKSICVKCSRVISAEKQKQTKLAISGSLATHHPNIASDWDYSRNIASGYSAETVSSGSSKSFWWKCPKGHSVSTRVSRRIANGCSTCKASVNMEIKANEEWNANPSWISLLHHLSNDLVKEKVRITKTLFYWTCVDCGYPFQCTVAGRTRADGRAKTRCNSCAVLVRSKRNSSTRLERSGSIGELFPELADEWATDLNNGLSPFAVTPAKNFSYWWRCKYGHEWKARASNRTSLGRNCPKCNDLSTSRLEIRIFTEFSNVKNFIQLRQKLHGFEADLYFPDLKIAVESDGYPWHSGEKKEIRDIQKNKMWEESGIEVIRIRDSKLKPLGKYCIQYQEKGDSNHFQIMCELLTLLQKLRPENGVLISLSKHYQQHSTFKNQDKYIELLSQKVAREDDRLSVANPELLAEWDYNKNVPLTPDRVHKTTSLKVHWVCSSCGNQWQARIANRVQLGRGCPVCAKKRVQVKREAQFIADGNTLKDKHPELALEYLDARNELDSSRIAPKSSRRVWWKCSICGREWETAVSNRTRLNSGCPSRKLHNS